jgi:pyruvate-ferredoxin/flavodoxin oxidoreductase
MVIANATGCSTIWGGSFPSKPHTVLVQPVDLPGQTLFEDNAEYGLGMLQVMKHRRERLITYVQDVHHHELKDGGTESQEEKELVSVQGLA